VPADSAQARDIAERMAAFDRNRSAESRARMTGMNLMVRCGALVATIARRTPDGRGRAEPAALSGFAGRSPTAPRHDRT
jgi:hypothetical protein